LPIEKPQWARARDESSHVSTYSVGVLTLQGGTPFLGECVEGGKNALLLYGLVDPSRFREANPQGKGLREKGV